MPNGPVCDRICPLRKPREDPARTPCAMFSTPSSTCSKVAVIGDYFPTTSLRGLPFTIISEGSYRTGCALSSSRSCVQLRGRRGQGSPTYGGHHGLPKCQDRRRIGPPKRLRRPQERQREQAPPPGGHFGSSALGLQHLGRYTRRGFGAQRLLGGLKTFVPRFVPRLKKIWADGAYTGEKLAGWCKERGEWQPEIVERISVDTEGFAVLPHR